jgi:ketosteroid isomerase-like protein
VSEHDAIRAVATRLFDSIERGDVEAVAACYAPDVAIWHNNDGVVQSREENLRTLAAVVRMLSERRYEDRRLDVFDGGFVQQHVLTGVRAADGARVSLPAALVCRVRDGKITRLDEYLDSAHVAALVGRAPQSAGA